ncbi:MAG: molybdopterin-binding protein [Rhizonema sp. NSF051]|nr:molybdopterin-binding protein [Rhizonema sp. NSF051]
MEVSARNNFKGTIKKLEKGPINTEVILEIAPGVEITAIITKASAENLHLAEGGKANAVVKASDVMIGV